MSSLQLIPRYGLWTPVLGFSGGNGTLAVTYAANGQQGWWDRFSRGVRIGFNVQTASFSLGTATGSMQLTGHPFTNRNVAGEHEVGPVLWGGLTKANFTHLLASMAANDSAIQFIACGSGQGPTGISQLDTLASPIRLRGHIDIRTA